MTQSKLEIARSKRGWTLEQAAEQCGVGIATYYRWEHKKTAPRGYNMQRLCEVYGMSIDELGLMAEPLQLEIPASPDNQDCNCSFIVKDLTMRLITLAFIPQNYQEVQKALSLILEEHAMANPQDKITRREALCRLATLPMVTTLGMASSPQLIPQRAPDDILTQFAASIAACWELSRSSEEEDILLAYQGVTAYMPTLKSLIKEGTSQQRKNAAGLAAQSSLLCNVLGWHFAGLKESAKFGQEAVRYSQETNDIPLQLSALKCLAWTYYYDQRDKDAVQSIEQATLLMQANKATLLQYVSSNIYSTLAVMQARAGQQASATIHIAEKTALINEADVYVDPPIPAFIRNSGMAWYHQRDYKTAMSTLSQIVDTDTLKAKMSLPERTRIEVLNTLTMATLKSPTRDLDLALHFWKAGIQGAKTLQSEQRFSEARHAFDVIEAIWPGEKRIADLRDLAVHW